MAIQIRTANRNDAAMLTALAMRSKQSNGYDDAFMAACREELTVTEQHFATTTYWVAEGEAIAGMVGLELDEEGASGEIGSFFIDPAHKRKGIGRLLWQAVLDFADAQGVKTLRLDADPAAEPFYEAMGFKTVGRVASGSIAGRTLPHMVLDLT